MDDENVLPSGDSEKRKIKKEREKREKRIVIGKKNSSMTSLN